MYVKNSIKLFSIFSTAQKLPKIFSEFFGKCKIFHKKYEKINGKHFNLLYAGSFRSKKCHSQTDMLLRTAFYIFRWLQYYCNNSLPLLSLSPELNKQVLKRRVPMVITIDLTSSILYNCKVHFKNLKYLLPQLLIVSVYNLKCCSIFGF